MALAAGADGVHVGQNDLTPAWVRRIAGADCLIGLSTHSEEEVLDAGADADYLCAGPVHSTPTKPGRPATGLELIAAAARRERAGLEPRPWFAIGGIDERTLHDIRRAGAQRIVVVRAIGDASEPASVAARLSRQLREKNEAC